MKPKSSLRMIGKNLYVLFSLVIMVSGLMLFPKPVEAATVGFALNTSGASHIGWMWTGSSWDNKAGWNTTAGYSAGSGDHRGSDYYADDWNLGSGNADCGQAVLSPIAGNIIYRGMGYNTNGTDQNGYGYEIIIRADANSNFAYRAVHLQKDSMTGATHVNMGDQIGRMGGSPDHNLIGGLDYWSGNSTACHTHSVLYKNITSNTIYGTTGLTRLTSHGSDLGGTGSTSPASPDATFATPFYNDATPASSGGTSACATYNQPGVTFFNTAQCTGTTLQFTSTGFRNLTDNNYNDAAKSMSVQGGWSARIYSDTNRGGATACITGTKWDMTQDKYDNGTFIVANGQASISSMELFNNGSCTPPAQSACATFSQPGVTFFNSAQCTGATLQFTTTGYRNLTDYNYNDAAKSMSVQGGWSARVYTDINKGGTSVCVTGTKWDMSQDKYENGTYIVVNGSGTITGVELFSNGSCTPVVTDTTAPTGKMTSPVLNSYNNTNNITLTSSVTDNMSGVAKVEYFGWSAAPWSNQQWISLGTATVSPYTLNWNVSGIQDGGIFITFKATDNAGNVSGLIWDPNWTVVTLDRTAPSGVFTAPVKNSNQTGSTVPLTINVSDNYSGVAKVDYYVWSPASWSNQTWILVGSTTAAPWTFNWSIVGKASTYVYVSAIITDKAGNKSPMVWDPNWTVFNIVH